MQQNLRISTNQLNKLAQKDNYSAVLESSPHQLRVYPSKRKFHARLSIKSERPTINSDEHIYDCKKLAANQKLKKGDSEKKLEQLNRRFSS
jgi:hypothetical protein